MTDNRHLENLSYSELIRRAKVQHAKIVTLYTGLYGLSGFSNFDGELNKINVTNDLLKSSAKNAGGDLVQNAAQQQMNIIGNLWRVRNDLNAEIQRRGASPIEFDDLNYKRVQNVTSATIPWQIL